MRNTALSTLVVALLLAVCPVRTSRADSTGDAKPLAVVSLASYDELPDSLDLVGKLSGRPKMGKGFQGLVTVLTQGRGLVGLDTARPWAFVVQAGGPIRGGYACLPVDDLDGFLELFQPHVEKIEDLGDGVRKIQGKGPRQVAFVKQKGDRWLFLSNQRERLDNTPEDPTELLGELPEQYDMAMRLHVDVLSADERGKLLTRLGEWAQEELKQRPGETEREFAVRKIVAGELFGVVRAFAEDLDTVTFGLSVGDDAPGVCVDVSATAKPDSEVGGVLGQLADAKTEFAGFRLPGAILSGHVTARYPADAFESLDELFDLIRTEAFEKIDAKEPSEERAKLGKDIVGDLLEVAEKTAASGRLDGAMSLVPGAEGVTLVAGRHVADGAKLEHAFRRFVDAVHEQYPAEAEAAIKTDAAEVRGVRLHTVALPVPFDAKNRDQVVRLFGEPIDVVVGAGEDCFYLAVGREAMPKLRQAIDRSAAGGPQPVPPMQVSLALGDLAKHVAADGEGKAQERAQKAVAALAEAPGNDHVELVAEPVENGIRLRLTIQEGVLRMIEAMHAE